MCRLTWCFILTSLMQSLTVLDSYRNKAYTYYFSFFQLYVFNFLVESSKLMQSLDVYLENKRRDEVHASAPLISCSPKNTLRDVIRLMQGAKIHRVYICPDKSRVKLRLFIYLCLHITHIRRSWLSYISCSTPLYMHPLLLDAILSLLLGWWQSQMLSSFSVYSRWYLVWRLV